MSNIDKLIKECLELETKALATKDPVDQARYDLAFWSLMHKHGTQILNDVYKEDKT